MSHSILDDPIRRDTLSCLHTWFCVVVALILTITATAKLITLLQSEPFLHYPDPVFTTVSPNLLTKQALELAVAAELLSALYIILKRDHLSASLICFWLVTGFSGYRMLAKAFGYNRPCSCMGRVLDWTTLHPAVISQIMVSLLWFMGAGSFFFLLASCFVRFNNPQPPAQSGTL